MLASGVPILQALDIVGSTSGNYVIDSALRSVWVRLSGTRLPAGGQHGHRKDLAPNMLVQMAAMGEDSGAIDQMLVQRGPSV